MKSLFIFRSPPDETTLQLSGELSGSGDPIVFSLYEEPIDYSELVKSIFECDRVICWW